MTIIMASSDEAKRAVLDRLSRVLGVPVDRFFTELSPTGTITNADECLRLWSMITTEDGRQQALRALQVILDLERAP